MSSVVKLTIMKITLSLIILCTILLTVGLGYFVYLTKWPIKIAEVHSFEVLDAPYKPGDYITYRVNYSKYKDVPGNALKTLITLNGSFPMSDELTNIPIGINKIVERQTENPIPYSVHPGMVILKGTWIWPINSLHNQVENKDSLPFEVVSKDSKLKCKTKK